MTFARIAALALVAACTSPAVEPVGPQTPPITGAADIRAWLAGGDYLAWSCEPVVHAARSPSPHGFNRICSNDLLAAAAATGDGEWPVGVAAVKELYADAAATTPSSYAMSRKLDDDSDGGANWYWSEADLAGQGKSLCVGCHRDADRDFVYSPVPLVE